MIKYTTLLLCILFPIFTLAESSAPSVKGQDAKDAVPLKVGDFVPDVDVFDGEGKPFSIIKTIRQTPAVLIFYRGGWCPYCNTHLGKLSEVHLELESLGYQVIAISPDSPKKISETTTKRKLPYKLYSDSSMEFTKAFGLAFKVDDKLVKKYKEEYKIDIEADSGKLHHLLPVPAAFLVNTNGLITYAYSNPDYKTRIDTKELVQTARKIHIEEGVAVIE